MASSSSDAWKSLRSLERICPLQADQLQTLRLTGSFLKNFLSSQGKWYIEDGNLKELLNAIQVVLQSADLDIHQVLADFRKISTQEDWQMPMNMDSVLTDLLEKFMLLNPEVEEVYNILSRTSRSITASNVEAVMGNLHSLLENTEDLMRRNGESSAKLKEELKAVQETLRSLRCFLGFTGKRCSKLGRLKDLLIHAELVIDIFSYLLYLCSVNTKMDNEMVNAMKLQLSSHLQKFSPSQANVRDIYINTLRASKTTEGNSKLVDELDLGFLDSLRDHILQLSDAMLSSMNSTKNQILSLQAELRSLTIFFAMDKPSKMYFEHGTVHNFLERTNAAIIDTASATYLLQRDEQNRDKVVQLKIIISDLQHIMRIKEDARKEYEVYFLNFVPSALPISYRQRIIGSDMKRTFEILNIEALVGAFKHQCVLVQNEMLSLSKAFGKITAMQLSPSQQDELEEQRMRFNDITPRTIYALANHYPREALSWMEKSWLFNVIQESKKITKELEDLESRITLETSGSKVSRKIGAEGKKITNSLIDEAGKMGKPLVNGTKKLHILSIADTRGIEAQLRWLETNVELIHPLKGEVESLRLKASFLKFLLSCDRYW